MGMVSIKLRVRGFHGKGKGEGRAHSMKVL